MDHQAEIHSELQRAESIHEEAAIELERLLSERLSIGPSNYSLSLHNTISSTSDYSPLIATEEQHDVDTNSQTSFVSPDEKQASDMPALKYSPFVLYRSCLFTFLLVLASLIVALEVLRYVSHHNHGLSTSDESRHYLWTYGPTAVFSILAIYWSKVEYQTKLLLPWKLMADKPRSVRNSLLLDYISPIQVLSIGTSLFRRHYPVTVAAFGSILITSMTVASTSLFVLEKMSVTHNNVQMVVMDAFDGASFDSSSVGSRPVLAAMSLFSGNLSLQYPPGTNDQYAVQSFNTSHPSSDPRFKISALIDTFSADLTCEPGRLVNATIGVGFDFTDLEGNLTSLSCDAGHSYIGRDHPGSPYSIGNVRLASCLQDGNSSTHSSLIITYTEFIKPDNVTSPRRNRAAHYATLDSTHLNATVLFCSPSHRLQKALVEVDASNNIVEVTPQDKGLELFAPQLNLALAFKTSLNNSGQVLADRTKDATTKRWIHNFDELFTILKTVSPQEPLSRYLDENTLESDSRHIYRTILALLAKQYLTTSISGTVLGSLQAAEFRLVLRTVSLRILEIALSLMIVCVGALIYIRPTGSTPSDPSTLGFVAAVLARSGHIKASLHSCGHQSTSVIEKALNAEYCVKNQYTADRRRPAFSIKASFPPSDRTVRQDLSFCTWWQPLALRVPMKLLALSLPLILIAALEVTYRYSRRNEGFADVTPSEDAHYAWTLLPALIMVMVKILYASFAFSVQLLDPFVALRRGSSSAKRTLFRQHITASPVEICLKGVASNRFLLAAAATTLVLGPFLTIVVSGLFDSLAVPKDYLLRFDMEDQLNTSMPVPLTDSDWTQVSLSAANLLIQETIPYPPGTYGSVIFPELGSDFGYLLGTGSHEKANATSAAAKLSALRPAMSCSAVPATDVVGKWIQIMAAGENFTVYGFTYSRLAGCAYDDLRDDGGYDRDVLGSARPIAYLPLPIKTNGTTTAVLYDRRDSNTSFADIQEWYDVNDPRLSQKIPCPNVTAVYGTLDYPSAAITVITCNYNLERVMANLTWSLPEQIVQSCQPDESTIEVLPEGKDIYPFKETSILNFMDRSTRDQNSSLDNLFEAVVNRSDTLAVLTPENGPFIANKIEFIYNTFIAQYLNTAARQTTTNGTTSVTGTLTDSNRLRLVQSEISTRILQGLLSAMCLCAAITFAFFDTRKLLPKNPCSIAAQASLFADSEFLKSIPEGSEWLSDEELLASPAFQGLFFSLGWWGGEGDERDGGDGEGEIGGRVFGIDVGKAR